MVSAIRLGLPLLNPYLDTNASFVNGVNFAVAGSPALDFPFFVPKGIVIPPTVVPLPGQINWFRQYLASICSLPTEYLTKLRNSVVFLGEIGGNDINYPISQGRSLQEIYTYIPSITGAIVNGIRDVIGLGARRIVVPGNFPIGCLPFVLTLIANTNATNPQQLDQFGCARSYNELAIYQNNYLQNALNSLRVQYPNVTIVYADYYGAFISVLSRASILGFDTANLFKACCGSGGPYNYDGTLFNCGKPGSTVCPNPSSYISWDGLHLTQEAYRRISEVLISMILPQLL
ncbi:OLC1v1033179C1 [Oldenlandia corymbosa var. corymbosa]|uniref:OLC1v1033179C1 n=1 Tax=Oldenlandia corymbosa var. corymbosa TaxID=529605 RepID=A0AAV1CQQ0_OLDCO|nr:OLC1v1033179C1 [Oldenlandia corymbosa var. corymbosa]